MRLYSYFRSSAAYRVRIAMHLKGLEFDIAPIHLTQDGGQQNHSSYRDVSPLGVVPALDIDGAIITQSIAIIEYLEEVFPNPSLFPSAPFLRAKARAMAQTIACDIHPINNLRVLNYLSNELGVSSDQRNAWYAKWVSDGFKAVEKLLLEERYNGDFCFGNMPTIADCCLIPQVFNAKRFQIPLDSFPRIIDCFNACSELPAFKAAHPSQQPDAE